MNITVENVSKLYGGFAALDHISFTLRQGIYGLLGPNGSGKTTLMRIMTDLLIPSTGRVLADGRDISAMGRDFRDKLGYLPQDFGIYPNFTAEHFLLYIAKLKGLAKYEAKNKTDKLLELVGLSDKGKQKLGGFSGGQRQRIGIAQALLNDPQILILDEPTAGLDPQERIHFRRILSNLSQSTTVLLSTHIVSDIEAIADEVILLRQGKMLSMKKPSDLLDMVEGKVWILTVPASDETKLTERFPCSNITHAEGTSTLRLIADTSPHPDAKPTSPNMEDLYLYCFKKTSDIEQRQQSATS